jgi:hypothetical protein
VRADVGQLLWIGFQGPVAPGAVTARLDAGDAGATILFKRNLVIRAICIAARPMARPR